MALAAEAVVEQVQALARQIEVNEEPQYSLAQLDNIFAQLIEGSDGYRYDQVTRNVGEIIAQRATREPDGVITADELGGLYNTFAGLNPRSEFRNVFERLLPTAPISNESQGAGKIRDTLVASGRTLRGVDGSIEIGEDDEIIPEQEGLFEDSIPIQKFSTIEAGQKLVELGLRLLGKELPVSYTKDTKDGILYSVQLGGFRTAYIPVGSVDGTLVPPRVLVTAEGEFPLSAEGLAEATTVPGKEAFPRHKFAHERDEPDVPGAIEVFEGMEINEPVVISDELLPFVQMAEQRLIESVLGFSPEVIASGRELIEGELADLGYSFAKVNATGKSDGGILYTANIEVPNEGKFNVEIPLTIGDAGVAAFPAKFFHGGKEYKLTRGGIARLLAHESNMIPVRYSSELIDVPYDELRKQLRLATIGRRYDRATEILNVIEDKFGEEPHKTALSDYAFWLKEGKVSFAARCGGCNYYEGTGKGKSTQDWCLLLDRPCREVRKTTAGICTKSSIDFDESLDSDPVLITTSKIALT